MAETEVVDPAMSVAKFKPYPEWDFLKQVVDDRTYTKELIERLNSERRDEPHARRFSIINFLAFLYLSLGGEEIAKGTELLETVLKEDPDNLNALSIYNYKECNANKLTKLLVRDDGKDCPLLKARALADIAAASCLTDQHQKQNNILHTKDLFEEAIGIGKDYFSQNELNECNFGMAFNLSRLDRLCNGSDVGWSYFKQSMVLFHGIASESHTESEGDDLTRDNPLHKRLLDMKGKSWAFMGNMMQRFGRNKPNKCPTLIDVGIKCAEMYKDYTWVECIKKAIEESPSNAAILRRASEAYCENQFYDLALSYAEKALSHQQIGVSYFMVAKVYIAIYNHGEKSPEENERLLDQAIENYNAAIDKHFKPCYVFRDLACAYVLQDNTPSALKMFNKAYEAIGGKKNKLLMKEWVTCITTCGQKLEDRTNQKYDFVTINNKDDDERVLKKVQELERKTRKRGYFFDRDCLPGFNIYEEMGDLVKKSKLFLIFMNKNFKNDGPCGRVACHVVEQRVNGSRIIPVLLDGHDKVKLNYPFNDLKPIRYDDPDFLLKIKL